MHLSAKLKTPPSLTVIGPQYSWGLFFEFYKLIATSCTPTCDELLFVSMQIKKFDDELRIVYGEVYAPNVPDSQGDYMTAETIRKMAHRFLSKGRTKAVDTNHDNELNGSIIVESFVARKGDPEFIEDSWVCGVHIPSAELWKKVKSGEINGFSLEGTVASRPRRVALYVPDTVMGETEEAKGHTHNYKVAFSQDDLLIEGFTIEDRTGHIHEIRNGTITEESAGHRHRYRLIDALDHIEVLDEAITGPDGILPGKGLNP